ncbi:MAG: hypothetical protein AAF290_16520 [Pseudomonadota bacterium]
MDKRSTTLDIQTHSTFELRAASRKLTLPKSRKCRALLAYLAVTARSQQRSHLASLFFGQMADPKGGLRWAVSQLKRCLPETVLVVSRTEIGLDYACIRLDLDDAQSLVSAHAPVERLREAEAKLTGEFLGDLSLLRAPEFESWRLAQAVRTNHQRVVLLNQLIERTLGTSESILYARKLTDLDVTRESSWAALIKTYQAVDQLAEARKVLKLAYEQLQSHAIPLGIELLSVARQSGIAPAKQPVAVSKLELRPRVVILNCRTISKRQSKLAAEITEAIYRAASVNKSVGVVSREISNRLLNDDAPIFEQVKSLDIDFVMEASIVGRRHTPALEVDMIEVDRGTCIHNWRLDFPADNRDDYLDRIEACLSTRFEIDFFVSMIDIANNKSVYSARDYFLLALPKIFSSTGFDPQAAHELLKEAVSYQPHFGEAYCATALIRMFLSQYNDSDKQIEKTLNMARQAVEMCQDDAFVLGMAATVVMHLDKQSETGRLLAERALALNPYSVVGSISMAVVLHYSGNNGDSLQFLDRIEANADTQPVTFIFDTIRCMVAYQQGDYADALRWGQKAIGQNPKYIVAIRYYLASLGQLGRIDESQPIANQLFALDRSENIAFFRKRSAYRIETHTERLCEGLRLGGLPASF